MMRLNDILHLFSVLVILGILTLYAGEWRIFSICFMILYSVYYIYTFVNKTHTKRVQTIKEIKSKVKKNKNVNRMLKLDEVNLIKRMDESDVESEFGEKDDFNNEDFNNEDNLF